MEQIKEDIIKNIKNLNDDQLYHIYQLVKHNTDKYTLNNNGVFVNFKKLSDDCIIEIQKIINSFIGETEE
jgi:hypothetical protein